MEVTVGRHRQAVDNELEFRQYQVQILRQHIHCYFAPSSVHTTRGVNIAMIDQFVDPIVSPTKKLLRSLFPILRSIPTVAFLVHAAHP